ncbi:TPA: dTDP-4-dehydrorhamnose 3,5-epimerase [Candidatus Nomurabacteria bacterium]|nr:dTDP-4-dehydrorhamnose 3,5-epimerase [Candidatus Nomurabacteria bacterium]
MEVIKTDFEGLFIVELKAFFDERGYFMESYNENFYKTLGISDNFVQDNISVSKKGVVRGLHFQSTPHAQGKLVSVLRGKVFDVAVDIRKDSPTFGKYFSCELSEENKKQVFIPAGFAHGFMSLVDNTIFSYKCTEVWNKESEGGLLWNDEEISITWPDGEKIISEKDKVQDSFKVLKSKIGII